MKRSDALVDDPITYLGGPLTLTPRPDYEARAIALTLRMVEVLARDHGALLDAFPAARAALETSLGEVRVLRLAAPARSLLGAHRVLLRGDWLHATEPDFLPLLGEGWSKPEPWGGIWGVGAAHELRLPFGDPTPKDAEIEVDVTASLPGSRTRLSVDVLVGGRMLATWEFTREAGGGVRGLPVPAALMAPDFPLLTLVFRPHEVGSPMQFDPDSKDDRLLGLAVRRLRYRLF
jgi:hypothetical protein